MKNINMNSLMAKAKRNVQISKDNRKKKEQEFRVYMKTMMKKNGMIRHDFTKNEG